MPERISPWLRARRALGRVRRRLEVETYDVFSRQVGESPPAVEAQEGYSLRWAAPGEIDACDEAHTELDAAQRADGERRLTLGHRAVIGTHGRSGLVVFTMWENPRNLNIPGLVKLPLGPHQSFIYKAFTSPEHRGRKLYQAGMRFVLAELAHEGKTELIGYAHVKKAASRRGLDRVAFGSLGRFWSIPAPRGRRTIVSRALTRYFDRRGDAQ